MKKFLTLALAVVLGIGAAEAQLVKSRTFNTVKTEKPKKGYNRLSIGYDAMFLSSSVSFEGASESLSFPTMNGFNINYTHGWSLSRSIPLFLEAGVGLGYNGGSFTDDSEDYFGDDYDVSLSALWVKIPINVAYRINLTDNISILPYTGINFKVNGIFQASADDGSDVDFLDMEGGKRFQMGWQIGAGFNFSKLYIGVQYGLDFMPVFSYSEGGGKFDINTSSLAINLGFTW